MRHMAEKITLGLTEDVTIISHGKRRKVKACIDTGATKSSLDSRLASELGLGPIVNSKLVRNAHGNTLRPVVLCDIEISGRRIRAEFTLADREEMNYKMLIGQNVLTLGFLIDPGKG